MGVTDWLNEPKNFRMVTTLPLLILFMFLVIFPLAVEIYVSFTDWTFGSSEWWASRFIGIRNYLELFTDRLFISSIYRTLIIVATCIILELIIGLGLALVFEGEFFGKKIFNI